MLRKIFLVLKRFFRMIFFESASSVNDDLWCFLAISLRVSFKSFKCFCPIGFKSSELNNAICIGNIFESLPLIFPFSFEFPDVCESVFMLFILRDQVIKIHDGFVEGIWITFELYCTIGMSWERQREDIQPSIEVCWNFLERMKVNGESLKSLNILLRNYNIDR